MNKKITFLILPFALFIFVGCGIKDNSSKDNTDSNKKSISSSIASNNAKISNSSNIELTDNLAYHCPFIFYGTDLIFPNPEENNRISTIPDPIETEILKSTLITDFADYSADNIAIVNDILYFSNGSENNYLCSIDLNDKNFKRINKHSVTSLTQYEDKLLYINKSSHNTLYIFDTLTSKATQITSDSIGYYIINNNYVIYQNLSDNSKIYSINIDGSDRQKLTDYTANSFTSYDGELLFFNSSDNNNLYSINPSTLDCKRLCIMNGFQLQNINNSLYFINGNDYNSLYSLEIDLDEGTVKYSSEIKDNINKYFVTENGIFYEPSINVNNIRYKQIDTE